MHLHGVPSRQALLSYYRVTSSANRKDPMSNHRVLGGAQLLTPVQEARMSIEAAPFKVDTLAVSNQVRHPHVVPCKPRFLNHVMNIFCGGAKAQAEVLWHVPISSPSC